MTQPLATIDEVLKAFKNPPSSDGRKLIMQAFEFAAAAHKDQTRASGMPYIHHCLSTAKILATIGMDAFLEMWRILDAEETFQHHKGNLEINLRRYSSYIRFQRNEYIRALAKEGLDAKEISVLLSRQLCEKIEISHIKDIIKKG